MIKLSDAVAAATLGALGVAIWQTWLTRRAVILAERTLRTTEESVKDAQIVLQAQMLTHAHLVTHVSVALEGWQGQMETAEKRLEIVRGDADLFVLKQIAEAAERTPEGLIHKAMYDACPDWLKLLYEAGAQHYFEGHGPALRLLWNFEEDAPRIGVERDLGIGPDDMSADALHRGLGGVRDLRAFLDRLLPAAWLESGAAIPVERFFDRT